MGIYVRFNRYTSCNYSRSLSIYCKTSEVSADCDKSTSVSGCFRNLVNYRLFFCFLTYLLQELWHWVAKFLLLTESMAFFVEAFFIFLPLIIFLLNFHILSVARKQRKRILAETKIANVYNSPEESANRMSFVVGFFSALKATKTFAIVVAVLMFCILIPAVVGPILYRSCSDTVSCAQIWYVVFHYELCGMNSVVNAYIYGIRHVKYRKAYLHILFKLISCHEATN